MTSTLERRLREETADWTAERKAAMIKHLESRVGRARIRDRVTHPAELGALLDPEYRITPAIEMISRSVETVLRDRTGRNLLVTMPPQEGKSYLCAVLTPLRALQLDPDCRVILTTYADALAEEHSHAARDLILRHGTGVVDPLTDVEIEDRLGLSLRADRASVHRWRIAEGNGGVVAAGIGATVTGRRADLLIIDDPYKNMQEADSATYRARVDSWLRSVAFTRLSPGASIILIHTRWHPDDLAGTLMREESELPIDQRTWRHLNIPAVSHPGVPDALGRDTAGVPMLSARGRSAEDFAATRRKVGERVWYALYQGVPAPPEGGLFVRSWFTDHALPVPPTSSVVRVVAVDPAETGKGDEAGVVAAALLPDGTVALTHDRSGHMTSDQWARRAVELAMETEASEISVETYTAGTTYVRVVESAIREYRAALSQSYDGREPETAAAIRRTHDLRVHGWTARGDAVARSSAFRQAVEVGTARVVGDELDGMIDQAVLWQVGQHQPDRVAAALIAHDRLLQLSGRKGSVGSPVAAERRGSGANPRRSAWLARKLT